MPEHSSGITQTVVTTSASSSPSRRPAPIFSSEVAQGIQEWVKAEFPDSNPNSSYLRTPNFDKRCKRLAYDSEPGITKCGVSFVRAIWGIVKLQNVTEIEAVLDGLISLRKEFPRAKDWHALERAVPKFAVGRVRTISVDDVLTIARVVLDEQSWIRSKLPLTGRETISTLLMQRTGADLPVVLKLASSLLRERPYGFAQRFLHTAANPVADVTEVPAAVLADAAEVNAACRWELRQSKTFPFLTRAVQIEIVRTLELLESRAKVQPDSFAPAVDFASVAGVFSKRPMESRAVGTLLTRVAEARPLDCGDVALAMLAGGSLPSIASRIEWAIKMKVPFRLVPDDPVMLAQKNPKLHGRSVEIARIAKNLAESQEADAALVTKIAAWVRADPIFRVAFACKATRHGQHPLVAVSQRLRGQGYDSTVADSIARDSLCMEDLPRLRFLQFWDQNPPRSTEEVGQHLCEFARIPVREFSDREFWMLSRGLCRAAVILGVSACPLGVVLENNPVVERGALTNSQVCGVREALRVIPPDGNPFLVTVEASSVTATLPSKHLHSKSAIRTNGKVHANGKPPVLSPPSNAVATSGRNGSTFTPSMDTDYVPDSSPKGPPSSSGQHVILNDREPSNVAPPGLRTRLIRLLLWRQQKKA